MGDIEASSGAEDMTSPIAIPPRGAFIAAALAVVLSVTSTRPLRADEPAPAAPAPAEQQGVLPVPDYSGDLGSRSFLSGDWNGTRTDLANKGIQFEVDLNQTVQSVVEGGRERDTEYGGSADYIINVDLYRMGLVPGAALKIRGESRFGESVNDIAGPLLPVNTDGFFPLSDDSIEITVSDLTYYQFLSDKFGLFLGKIDTLDGDPNEFAGGRGNTQFLNANFVFNAVGALLVPYSTLGVGVLVTPNKHISISSVVMNSADASTTSGFEGFGDGYTWSTEADFQYQFARLPGGQNVGFTYSGDRDFAAFGGKFVFQPGEGLVPPTTDESWSAYWSAWQYLYVEDADAAAGPVNAADGMPDHQGFGLFARAGIADDDTNPIEWTVNGGIGGRGVIPGRDNDVFGIGYYYSGLQSARLSSATGVDDTNQGFEAFYNVAITPAAHLTLDVQVVDAAFPEVDTAIILGARLNIRF
jgi:porin